MIQRRVSKPIFVGDLKVGGDAPISVQSMTKTDTRDVEATVAQIKGLEEVGCEIIRVEVTLPNFSPLINRQSSYDVVCGWSHRDCINACLLYTSDAADE